jgi:hypothetical protein
MLACRDWLARWFGGSGEEKLSALLLEHQFGLVSAAAILEYATMAGAIDCRHDDACLVGVFARSDCRIDSDDDALPAIPGMGARDLDGRH